MSSANGAPMVAVIVLDSVSTELVGQLLDDDRLPTLAELRRRGEWVALENGAAECGTGHVTLFSGVAPEQHGLYHPFQWSPASQRVAFHDRLAHPEAVWERLGRSGRRSLVVDPYETFAPSRVEGIYLSGWQLRNRLVLPSSARPRGAGRALSRRFSRAPLLDDVYGPPSVGWLSRAKRILSEAPARITALTTDLLSREPFDLLVVDFAALHLAGHHLWDLSQLPESALPAARAAGLEHALADVYAEVDGALARILSALPPDADVILVSPVGMRANSSRSDLLPEMLQRVLAGSGPGGSSAQTGSWLWAFRAAVPMALRRSVGRAIPAPLIREVLSRLYLRGIDWSRTPAFVIPGDFQGYVRLNLRGREERGIVPAADAEDLLDEIATGLGTFADPDGNPAVDTVTRVPKLRGWDDREDSLPDLLVRWSGRPSTRLPGVSSPRYGDVVRRGRATGRPGNHAEGGWTLLAPGSARRRVQSRPATHTDIASTVCSLLGVEAPGMAGEPLLERA